MRAARRDLSLAAMALQAYRKGEDTEEAFTGALLEAATFTTILRGIGGWKE